MRIARIVVDGETYGAGGRVFVGYHGGNRYHHGVVYRGNRNRYHGRITQCGQRRTVVAYNVGEAVRTVVIQIRCIRNHTGSGIYGNRSVCRRRYHSHRVGYQAAVHIGVVAQYKDGHGNVFGRCGKIVNSNRRVVHGGYRNGYGSRVAQVRRAAVAHAVGKYVRAVIVGVGRIGIRTVGIQYQCSVGRVIYHGIRGTRAVGVAVVRGYIAAYGRIFRCGVHVVHSHGRVVHGRYRYGYDGRVAQRRQRRTVVADLVNEGIRTAEVRIRRIRNHTRYAVHGHGSMGRLRTDYNRTGYQLTIHIAVVGQYVNGYGRIFGCADVIGVGNRRVIYGRYRNRYRGRIAEVRRAAVAYAVDEHVGSGVVRIGRIGIGSVGIQYQRTVSRPARHGVRSTGTVGVAVVRGYITAYGRILGRGISVFHGHGRIVHRGDGHIYRSDVRRRIAVIKNNILQAVDAVVVEVRRIGDSTCERVHRYRAVGRLRGNDHRTGHHMAHGIGIVIVAGDVDDNRRVFRRRGRIIHCYGRERRRRITARRRSGIIHRKGIRGIQ